jgi:TonB-dependent starch-binding outer membrane protein SusC
MVKTSQMKQKHRFGFFKIIFLLLIGISTIPNSYAVEDLSKELNTEAISTAIPQEFILGGTITDAITGEPLPGVNIVVKGTSSGTISEINGKYTITVPSSEAVILYSYVGYISQEVIFNGQKEIDVALEEDYQSLEEVVVIGYGTQRAEDLTGSVAVVSVADMKKANYPTIGRALQGRAPGVLVTQTSGRPGSSMAVKIRGIGSINSSTEPLYIVDNLATGGLSGINPDDIESIQILKDASATAIYGARGANGVVIITTKRGNRNGKIKAEFSAYTKMSDLPKYRWYDVMNTEEYVNITNLSYMAIDTGVPPMIISSDSLRSAYGNTDTDWQNALLRTGIGQNYHAGLSGGSESSNFSFSANYYTEEGVTINTDFERLNLRANSDYSILNGRVKIGESILIGHTADHGSSGGQGNRWVVTSFSTPLMPIYEDRNLGGFAGPTDSICGRNEQTNAVAEQMLRNQDRNNLRILSNIYADVTLFKGLSYKINVGLTYGNTRTTTWLPEYELGNIGNRSNPVSILNENTSNYQQTLIENTLNYFNQFGDHNLTMLAGHVRQRDYSDSFGATGREFRDPNVHTLSQAEILTGQSSYINEHKIDSYLARVLYNYKGKYLFTASIRRDGSSKFGPDGERYGNFPSFSAGWKLNEDFLQHVEEIDILKLRIGWGHTGNMNIGNFVYDTYVLRPDASRYLFGYDETLHLGVTDLRSTGNPTIQWEHSIMTNIGVDLRAFDNRVEMSAEYYIKNQDNMLTTIELSMLHGKDWDDQNSNPWYNLGKVQNKGVEINLLLRDTYGDFNYSIGGNFTTINNKVIELPNSTPIYTDHTITQEGNSIGSFYGYVAEGIFQSQEEADKYGGSAAQAGDIRFKDINKDGGISAADRIIIGKPTPDFIYSLNIDLAYKGVDLVVFLNGMQNLDVLNMHYSYIGIGTDRNSKDLNKLRSVMDYWTPENNSMTQTRLDVNDPNYNARTSTWFLEDASFLRVQSLQIGYALPRQIVERLKINSARIYIGAQNLHVFSKYRGYDPEVSSNNVLSTGIDQGAYPMPRSFIAGIKLGL